MRQWRFTPHTNHERYLDFKLFAKAMTGACILPVYRNLNMDHRSAYNLFPRLLANKEKLGEMLDKNSKGQAMFKRSLMNNIRAFAEEVIRNDLLYSQLQKDCYQKRWQFFLYREEFKKLLIMQTL